MKTLHLWVMIFLLTLSGCKNPLDDQGEGRSTIDQAFNALLQKPGSFSFSNYEMQSSQVVLYWQNSERAESYQVRYGTAAGLYSTTASCSASPCTITGLTNGTQYFFTVIASNSRGSTNVSSEISVSPANTPSIPTGVTATSSNSSVVLSWSASTGAGTIKYKILRSTISGSGYVQLVTNLSSTSYTDNSVSNGSNYYYVVRSYNQYGEGTNSAEVTGNPMAAPAAPTGLSATGSTSQVSLSWTASSGSGTIKYTVMRSATTGSGYVDLATNITGTTYSDSTLSNGVTYYYVVKAFNEGGTSSNSSEVSSTPLAASSSITISAATSQVTISWSAVTAATSYKIYRSTTSGDYTSVTPFTSASTSYTDSTVTNGTTYYYVITAVKGASESSRSSETNVQPLAAPTGFAAAPGTTSADLSWNSVAGASSYTLYRSTTSGSYGAALASGITSTSYSDSGLTAGTTYYYTLKALTTNSVSSSSSEVSAKPFSSFAITAVTVAGTAGFQITWGAATGATSYTIKYGTSSGVYGTTLTNRTSPSTISPLTPGTIYYFKVFAVNSTGSTGSSNESVATSLGAATLTSLTSQVGGISASWSAAGGATSYDVLYGTVSGNYTTALTNKTSPHLATPLTAGTTYYFKVRANNASGSSYSNEMSTKPYQNLSLNIPFSAGTSSSYTFSDSTISDLIGGLLRLTPTNPSDSAATDFNSGSMAGTSYDSTNKYVRLDMTTNTSELDSTWMPKFANLEGYWKLNEASWNGTTNEVTDSSGKGIHGVAVNSASTSATAKFNRAGSFDGVSKYVSISKSWPNTLQNRTISAWVRSNGTSNATSGPPGIVSINGYKVGFGNDENDQYGIFFNDNQQKRYSCMVSSGGQYTLVSTTDYPANSWNHVVCTESYNGSTGTYRLYINGNLDKEMTLTSLSTYEFPSEVTRIGAYKTAFNRYANAFIDDVAIWSATLTDSEVKTIYDRQSAQFAGTQTSRIFDGGGTPPWTSFQALTTLPFNKPILASATQESSSSTTGYSNLTSALATGLVALWHFDETSGSTIADSSGNANHGTAYNSISSVNCETSGITANCKGANGVFGKAANFTGTVATSQYVAIPNSTTLENVQENNSTYSAWVYLHALPTATDTNYSTDFSSGIIIKAGYHLGLSINTSGVNFTVWNNSNSASVVNTTLSLKKWNHIVGVFDKTNLSLKIYVNGEVKQSISLSAGYTIREYGQTLFTLGTGRACTSTTSWCNPLNGLLDEAAIWSRALSSSEVLELYRRGANRIKYQVRSCTTADCSEASNNSSNSFGWQGPDGSSSSYYSDLTNVSANAFSTSLSLSNRYFQYRSILEANETNTLCNYGAGATTCSPELKRISIGSATYSTVNAHVTNNSGIGSLFQTLTGFTVTQGSNGCTGDRYTISADGTTFWYYTGSAWAVSDGSYGQASSSSQINSNISSLVAAMGTGTLQVRTYLSSDGSTTCEIDNILLQGAKY